MRDTSCSLPPAQGLDDSAREALLRAWPGLSTVDLPAYVCPEERSAEGRLIDILVRQQARFWQDYFDGAATFPEKLARLHSQQVEAGLVRDDLSALQQYSLRNHKGNAFLIDCNPARAQRGVGAGRRELPRGALVRGAEPRCLLCPDNVLVLQHGLQVGYEVELPGGRRFFVYCNPFPLGPRHFTVSSAAHTPQDWPDELGRVAEHLLWLAGHCGPEYLVLANGVHAGASIEGHRHYQILAPVGGTPLPLQSAARRPCGVSVIGARGEYPLLAVRIAGEPAWVQKTTADVGARWRHRSAHATENLVVCVEDGAPVLYYVPRDRRFQGTPLVPRAGSLEAFGELVLEAKDALGFITFRRAAEILRSIRAPQAPELIADLARHVVATA